MVKVYDGTSVTSRSMYNLGLKLDRFNLGMKTDAGSASLPGSNIK